MQKLTLAAIFLAMFAGFLFFVGLGDRDLLASHEARAAQDAQMMLSDGNWGLPRLFDGHVELQKPPLYYWLVALCGKLLGGEVNAWAVRLPAALSALGCVLFLLFLCVKSGRPLAGFLAGLVLATCLHFTWLARVGRIDMPLTFAITVACGCFFLGMQAKAAGRRPWRWYLISYVAIALGVLLKGPIAIVLVGVVIAPFAFIRRRWFNADGSAGSGLLASLWWGVPLLLAIATPWFIWANWQTNNQVWEVFFWYHNIERGLGGSETLASHPFWFYVPRALVDLLPWSLVLPPAAWCYVRRVGWRGDVLAVFGGVWFLAVIGLLSCMSFKRADYLLPAYPGMALFIGCVGERIFKLPATRLSLPPPPEEAGFLQAPGGEGRGAGERGAISPALLKTCITLMLAAYALGWGIYNFCLVPRQEANWPYRELARAIRAQSTMPVIFFQAESHILAYHVGRPLDTILEWENLDIWASRPEPIYFIMPPDCAAAWPSHLHKGRLEEVFRTSDHSWGKRERLLVVMRSCP